LNKEQVTSFRRKLTSIWFRKIGIFFFFAAIFTLTLFFSGIILNDSFLLTVSIPAFLLTLLIIISGLIHNSRKYGETRRNTKEYFDNKIEPKALARLDSKVSARVTLWNSIFVSVVIIYALITENSIDFIAAFSVNLVNLVVFNILWGIYKPGIVSNDVPLRLAIFQLMYLFIFTYLACTISVVLIFIILLGANLYGWTLLINLTLYLAYLYLGCSLAFSYVFFTKFVRILDRREAKDLLKERPEDLEQYIEAATALSSYYSSIPIAIMVFSVNALLSILFIFPALLAFVVALLSLADTLVLYICVVLFAIVAILGILWESMDKILVSSDEKHD